MKKLLTTLAVLAAVGMVFANWYTEPDAQDWQVGGTKVDVIMDPPQGFSKGYQKNLEATASTSMLHVSDAGYWFHLIGIQQVASFTSSHMVCWNVLPYASTTDSTGIIATPMTVVFPGSQTTGMVMLPFKCYQFSTKFASPSHTAVASHSTMKAFKAIGYQKKHN